MKARGSAAGNGPGYAGKRSKMLFPIPCGMRLP